MCLKCVYYTSDLLPCSLSAAEPLQVPFVSVHESTSFDGFFSFSAGFLAPFKGLARSSSVLGPNNVRTWWKNVNYIGICWLCAHIDIYIQIGKWEKEIK